MAALKIIADDILFVINSSIIFFSILYTCFRFTELVYKEDAEKENTNKKLHLIAYFV